MSALSPDGAQTKTRSTSSAICLAIVAFRILGEPLIVNSLPHLYSRRRLIFRDIAKELDMDALAHLTIEAECVRLMNRFTWAVDAMDYDQVVSLFVPDCVFSRADKTYAGHAGLRASLNGRPRDRTTRHVLTNVVIDVTDADHASGKSYCTVFGYRGSLAAGAEAPLGLPDSLILYEGAFVRSDADWRIARWHIGLSFRKPAAPSAA